MRKFYPGAGDGGSGWVDNGSADASGQSLFRQLLADGSCSCSLCFKRPSLHSRDNGGLLRVRRNRKAAGQKT